MALEVCRDLNSLKETLEMVLDGMDTSTRFGDNMVESVKWNRSVC